MQILRAVLILVCALGCMCGSSFGQEMKEGGGGGGAHYCIKRDTATPQGTNHTYIAIRNTCSQDVAVIACGRLERGSQKNEFVGKVACMGGTLKQNAYVDPTELSWECDDSGCDNWTFVWNAEYADSGIKPTSPMKNEANRGK
jgi:hypothetical protein